MRPGPSLICALALLAAMIPARGQAQWANSIGIYTSAQALSSEIFSPRTFVNYDLFFVLNDPRTASGAPLAAVTGFEFRVSTDTQTRESFFRLEEGLPSFSINIGYASDPSDATYIVGVRNPVPVSNRRVTLMKWRVMLVSTARPVYLYLGPVTPASVPGQLAFVHWTAEDVGMLVGATGTQPLFTLPEFAFGAHLTPPVATETVSFGAVKALFRQSP